MEKIERMGNRRVMICEYMYKGYFKHVEFLGRFLLKSKHIKRVELTKS